MTSRVPCVIRRGKDRSLSATGIQSKGDWPVQLPAAIQGIKQPHPVFKDLHLQKCINPLPRHTGLSMASFLSILQLYQQAFCSLALTFFLFTPFSQSQLHPQLPGYFPSLTLQMGFVSFRKLGLTGLAVHNTLYLVVSQHLPHYSK